MSFAGFFLERRTFMIKKDEIISSLNKEEKVYLLNGVCSFYTRKLDKCGIRELHLSDGPHGLRTLDKNTDLTEAQVSKKAVCFPSSAATACSFDEDLFYEIGVALAEEALNYGVDIILGPAINIQRNPLCGRHFEYVSEDPLLAGKFASNYIKGIQSKNVGACVKHYACNNNENTRFYGSSFVDERALRDIYLKPFEIAIKESSPYTVMCSYNKINGVYAAENKILINDILRDTFGFKGLVMTDWGATNVRSKSIEAGVDLEMPGDSEENNKQLLSELNYGLLDENEIDRSVTRLIELVDKIQIKPQVNCDFEKHHSLSMKASLKSAVLLKKGKMLPLNVNEKITVLGDFFNKPRYQGMGSSLINPYKIVGFKEVFEQNNIDFKFIQGFKASEEKQNIYLENDVIKGIKPDEKVLIFLGLPDLYECEGVDRKHMKLPENQLTLMTRLLQVTKNVVVVLLTGSPVELPFINKIDSCLLMNLSGEAVGESTFRLLYGKDNPSGHLSCSWPKKEDDIPFNFDFKNNKDILYKESIYVGYRYYSTFNVPVLFPFGYGLTYSNFKYDNFKINHEDGKIFISLTVENDSDIPGEDLILIFYGMKNSSYYRPNKNLIGFKKVFVDAREKNEVSFEISDEALAIYNLEDKKDLIEEGSYTIYISKDANSSLYEKEISVNGSKFLNYYSKASKYYDKKDLSYISNDEFYAIYGENFTHNDAEEINIYTPLKDFSHSNVFGKLFYKILQKQIAKTQISEKDKKEQENLELALGFTKKQCENFTLKALSNLDSKSLPLKYAKAICFAANGHYFKALKQCCKRK